MYLSAINAEMDLRECQWSLICLFLCQCSDYKPVVPVGGCDNVLKSLNLAAHPHLRETRVPELMCLHPELPPVCVGSAVFTPLFWSYLFT